MERSEFVASVQQYLITLDLTGFSAFEHAPINAVKVRALASLASEADRAARQFKETWPEDIATVSDLKNFIGDDTPKSSAALGHLIERVGMKSGHRFTFRGRKETLLIVRGSLTADDFEKNSAPILAEKINTARIQFSAL